MLHELPQLSYIGKAPLSLYNFSVGWANRKGYSSTIHRPTGCPAATMNVPSVTRAQASLFPSVSNEARDVFHIASDGFGGFAAALRLGSSWNPTAVAADRGVAECADEPRSAIAQAASRAAGFDSVSRLLRSVLLRIVVGC